MAGFPQRNLLVGSQVWTGDPTQDAQASQEGFDTLALLLGQLKRRVIAGLAGIASSVVYGVTDGSNATAGYIGEYVEAIVAAGSVGGFTTSIASNITSMTLTAGDWDVEGAVLWNGAVTGAGIFASVSSQSLTHQTAANPGRAESPTMPTATNGVEIGTGRRRFSLSGPTTMYLVATITFTGGVPTAGGWINARRVH